MPVQAAPTLKPIPIRQLTLSQSDLETISPLVGYNISTREELIKRIELLSTMNVQGQKLTLEPNLLSRLKSRCFGASNFNEWLHGLTLKLLRDYAGL